MAAAEDLKSSVAKATCGFESHSPYCRFKREKKVLGAVPRKRSIAANAQQLELAVDDLLTLPALHKDIAAV